MTNPIEHTIATPSAMDLAISQINTKLETNLSWLTTAYGIVEKREKTENGQLIRYPAVYATKYEYLDLTPDRNLGNYSFFSISNYNTGLTTGGRIGNETASFELIFWYDFKDIYGATADQENNRSVIALVLPHLSKSFLNAAIKITAAYERSEQIFQEYTIPNETRDQYLMRPYGGFRLSGTIQARPNC